MVGNLFMIGKISRLSVACVAVIGLVACDENGQFLTPSASGGASDQPVPANAPGQVLQEERDIERPDIFEVTDSGLWDGRPSLGGVWVAHPDVQDPERVLIRNPDNGRSIIGALFRRERENPGPLLQVSSDAAEDLGLLPGAPTLLSVVALRREEVEVTVPAAQSNPVVASLEAPVSIESAPLDPAPVAADGAASAVTLPPAVEAATAAAEATAATAVAASAIVAPAARPEPAAAADEPASDETIDVSSVLDAPVAPADGPLAQVGVYSVEANADAAVATMTDAGIAGAVLSENMGGRTVWRVVAGPLVDETVVQQLKTLGFVDAFVIEDAPADAE